MLPIRSSAALIGLACALAWRADGSAEPQTYSLISVAASEIRVQSDQERALIDDINDFRKLHGLAPLAVDGRLSAFAEDYAREMALRGFIGHTSPDGTSFDARIKLLHRPWSYASENIALNADEPRAHVALIQSAPHRRNLLDTRATLVGVAVVAIGEGRIICVEDFLG